MAGPEVIGLNRQPRYYPGTNTTITKVILAGASGKLGSPILQSLLFAGTFTVTVLSRSSSRSKYPPSVHEARISDRPSNEELIQIFRGQDAIIAAFAGSNADLQIQYADAAAQAGVQRFIPADFGSCDSSSPRALELIPLYRAKQRVREHLQQLASTSQLSWTSLVCGHFFDYGLTSGLLQYNLKTREALIFDGGNIKWSATTLETIGQAVVRVLQQVEETKNRMLYIQSLCVSQNEVLESLERLSGKSWHVKHMLSDDFIRDTQAKLSRNSDDAEEWEDMVSVLGIVDSNWERKDDFANMLLALNGEDLDQLIRKSTNF